LKFQVYKWGYTIYVDIFFEYDKGNRRGQSKKFIKKRRRLDIIKFVFGNRVTDKWNNLPQYCINGTTLMILNLIIIKY